MDPGNLQQSERYCVFQSGDGWYGIPALSIQRVAPRPNLTRTPHSDPVLRGICHDQNEFVPVFSLRSLTQVQYDQRSDTEQQMLVVLGPAGSWGMLIDEALGLANLETSISTFNNQDDDWSKVSAGSASYRNQVLQILDPLAVYQYAVNLLDMFWLDQEEAVASLGEVNSFTT